MRLGVVGDWDHPYTTMSYPAEAQIAREIFKFVANGLLYRGSKPVMWSVVEKTALRGDGFEEFRGRAHLVEQRGGKCLHFAGTSSLAPARESHPRSRFRRVDASAFAAHALPLLGSHSGAESLALFESHGVPTVDEAGAASPPPSAAPAKAAE